MEIHIQLKSCHLSSCTVLQEVTLYQPLHVSGKFGNGPLVDRTRHACQCSSSYWEHVYVLLVIVLLVLALNQMMKILQTCFQDFYTPHLSLVEGTGYHVVMTCL